MASRFGSTVRGMLRAMSRKGVLREAERENLLQLLEEYPDEFVGLVERLILREVDRIGQGELFGALLERNSEAAVSQLKILFPKYRQIVVNILNEAIIKSSLTGGKMAVKVRKRFNRRKPAGPVLATSREQNRNILLSLR